MAFNRTLSGMTAAGALSGAEWARVHKTISGSRKSRKASLSDVLAKAVDIRKFGVLVDGTTDNAAAIATAVASGEVLYLPAGTILTSTFATRSGLIVVGSGWDSIVKLKAGANTSVFQFDSKDDWWLSHFQIDGNKSNQTLGQVARGVYANGTCNRWRLHHIKLHDVLDHGFMTSATTSGTDAEIESCVAQDCGSAAHTAAGGPGGTGFATGGDGLLVMNCHSSGNALDGFKGGGGVVYQNCVAKSNNSGFETGFATPELTEAQFIACRAINNVGDGFRHAGQGDVLLHSGCTASGNGGSGICLVNGVVDALITGCLIRNNGLSATRSAIQGNDGIMVCASGGTVPQHVLIDNNVVIDNTNHASDVQYGINIDKGGDDVVVGRGNVVHGNKTQSVIVSASSSATVHGFDGHPARQRSVTDTSVTGTLSTTDLKTFTIPARAISIGQTIEFDAHGTVTGTAGTKIIRLSINGATIIVSNQTAGETQNWGVRGTVTFTPGALTEAICFVYENGGTSQAQFFQTSFSLGTALVIKVTATLGNVADTVTQKFMKLDIKY